MHSKILISKERGEEIRAFVLASHHRRRSYLKVDRSGARSESVHGTKSYSDGLQRAFNRAKQQVFFNPDMQYFVTLTYAGIQDSYEQVMHDVKMLVKSERRNGNDNFKYIYIFEWQKRGSLHVHMITNSQLTTYKNKNGYDSLTYWKHGFTSMLHIGDFDSNFKPHLYLFKYMRKAERIGKSFVHTSRNLNNFEDVSEKGIKVEHFTVVNQEYTYHKFPNNPEKKAHFYSYYLKYDRINERNNYIKQKRNYDLWHKVLLNSTRVRVKKVENHLQH